MYCLREICELLVACARRGGGSCRQLLWGCCCARRCISTFGFPVSAIVGLRELTLWTQIMSSFSFDMWDLGLADVLVKGPYGARIMQLFRFGGLGVSDYSGFDAPSEAMRCALPSLAHRMNMTAPSLKVVRACDWGPLQQHVLKTKSILSDGGEMCVLADLNDRMPKYAKDRCTKLAPTKDTSIEVALSKNAEIRAFLHDSRGDIFKPNASSMCLTHKCMCPVHPLWAIRQQDVRAVEEGLAVKVVDYGDELPQRKSRKQQQYPRLYEKAFDDVPPMPWWKKLPGNAGCDEQAAKKQRTADRSACSMLFEGECDEEDGEAEEPLSYSVAGLVCTDWTGLGSQRREAGVTERHHFVWSEERHMLAEHLLEDLYFVENSERYPIHQKQVEEFKLSHTVVYVRASPGKVLHPVHRPRYLAAGLNNKTCVWVGPDPGDASAIQADFERLFGRTLKDTGDAYFVASKREVTGMVRDMALDQKNMLPAEFPNKPMAELLHLIAPVGVSQRLAEWNDVVEAKLRSVAKENWADGEAFLADLDHHPHTRSQGGKTVPPLPTHSRLWSWRHARLMTGMEALLSQGVDVYESMSGFRGLSPLTKIFRSLPPSDQKFLAGNAMHIPTMAMFMMYIFGNTVRRSDYCRMDLQLPVVSEDEEEEVKDAVAGRVGGTPPLPSPFFGGPEQDDAEEEVPEEKAEEGGGAEEG